MCAASSGSTLEFPVLQPCETGSTAWNQPTVKGQDEPELPAPAVAVIQAAFGSGRGRGMTTTGTVMSRWRQPPRRRLRPAGTTCSHHAGAHNHLVSATPAADSTVTEQPSELVLTTNDDLLVLASDGAAAALWVVGPDGGYYGDGCVSVVRPSASMPLELGERAPTR